jgi:hypothetical protein
MRMANRRFSRMQLSVVRSSTIGLLLVLAASGPLAAQDEPPARPPTSPDSTVTPGVMGEGFEAWRTRVAERGRAGVSFLVEGERYHVLMLTPMAIDAQAPDSLIVKTTKGCRESLELDSATVVNTADIQPWDAFDSASRARPLIALAVFPAEVRRFDCHAGLLARFAAMSRGALYGRHAAYSPRTDVARVEVRRGGVLEPSVLAGRAPVTKFEVGRSMRDGTQHVRVYIEPEAFAPDGEGNAPNLEVHVWNMQDEEPDILPMPEQVIRAVWQQMMPWRAMTLGRDGTAPKDVGRLELPMPRDSVLRVAHERYRAGDVGVAASTALDRLMYRPMPPRAEIRNAMLLSASSFSAYGEDEASLSLVADVVEVFPCFTLSPDAPASMHDMVDRVPRAKARCTSIPLPVIALRSVVPGWGQATGPLRKRLALTILASTAGGYLLATGLHKFADSEYEDYLAYRGNTTPGPKAIIARAELGRNLGNGLMIGAAATWVGAGVEAVWAEYQHKRRLAEVRDVGRRSARPAAGEDELASPTGSTGPSAFSRVTPLLSPNLVGFSVSFR